MIITFELKEDDRAEDIHMEDKLEIIRDSIADGFRVPNEYIKVLGVK